MDLFHDLLHGFLPVLLSRWILQTDMSEIADSVASAVKSDSLHVLFMHADVSTDGRWQCSDIFTCNKWTGDELTKKCDEDAK